MTPDGRPLREGGNAYSSSIRRFGAAPRNASDFRSLTHRERVVFLLLAQGRSNKDVACELEISLGTAKKHRENLQRKLNCRSSANLARLAIREGLIGA
jgi:DNA-binding NarL/FixJ family response regulator